jgi:peptide chain release factor subunit 1
LKISLYLPKGTRKARLFVEKEIFTARKIQDKQDRETVVGGLNKVLTYLNDDEVENRQGYAFFIDEDDFAVIPYDGPDKLYNCGKEIITGPFSYLFDSNKYLLCAMDTNHCTIGLLQGKKLEVLWDKEFYIQGKHGSGGQSAARFERDREEQRKQMFKTVAAKLADLLQVHSKRTQINVPKERIFKRLKIKGGKPDAKN